GQGPGFRGAAAGAGSVAHLLLQVLPALLLVDGALGGQARLEALQADLLARIHAVAVFTRVHALERAVDLADQLAVAVAGAQLQRILGLAGGALGVVAHVAHLVLEVLDGLLGLLHQVRAPFEQALAEVLELQRAHVLLLRVRAVAGRQDRAAGGLVGLVRNDLVAGLGRGRRRRAVGQRARDLAGDLGAPRRGRRGRGDLGGRLGRRLLGRGLLLRRRLRGRGLRRRGPGRRGLRGRLRGGLRRRLGDGLLRRRLRRGLLRGGPGRRGGLRDRLLRRGRLLHRGLGRRLLRRRLGRGLLRSRLGRLLRRGGLGRGPGRGRLLRGGLRHLPGGGLGRLRGLLHGLLHCHVRRSFLEKWAPDALQAAGRRPGSGSGATTDTCRVAATTDVSGHREHPAGVLVAGATLPSLGREST